MGNLSTPTTKSTYSVQLQPNDVFTLLNVVQVSPPGETQGAILRGEVKVVDVTGKSKGSSGWITLATHYEGESPQNNFVLYMTVTPEERRRIRVESEIQLNERRFKNGESLEMYNVSLDA